MCCIAARQDLMLPLSPTPEGQRVTSPHHQRTISQSSDLKSRPKMAGVYGLGSGP